MSFYLREEGTSVILVAIGNRLQSPGLDLGQAALDFRQLMSQKGSVSKVKIILKMNMMIPKPRIPKTPTMV